MDMPLDEEYFTWLYSQIASAKLKNPSRTYWFLVRQLYTKEFIWLVPNDDNRLEDGRELRREFLESCDIYDPDPEWLGLGCSMFEMLLALSRRLSFEAEGEPRDWFWHLIDTVDLFEYNDRVYKESSKEEVDEVLDRIIWRRYSPNGHGGLFPLRNSAKDQRDVELWYQASAYLIELF